MNKQPGSVPFGYEPPADADKGTLIYYDTFESSSEEEWNRVADYAIERSFRKLVLYLIHEETARRMSKKTPVSAYYKREDRLERWLEERGDPMVSIDGWEGKRKKYTPIDSALRHLTETLPGPHFVYMTPDTANSFASYSSFESWIVNVRLLLPSEPGAVHPMLAKYRHRWSPLIPIR